MVDTNESAAGLTRVPLSRARPLDHRGPLASRPKSRLDATASMDTDVQVASPGLFREGQGTAARGREPAVLVEPEADRVPRLNHV